MLLTGITLPSAPTAVPPELPLSLAGNWRFQLDRANVGVAERWFDCELAQTATLPGDLSAQDMGDDVTIDTKWTGQIVDRSYFTEPEYAPYRQPGNIKLPFWLQPEKYYAGVAWFERHIEIPAAWAGRRIVLTLERPHWKTTVWLDGREVGSNDSLSTPHVYDLGTTLTTGRHRLAIRVDNSLIVDIGVNSHSISDHTQGNWNGIVGRIELSATAPAWIDDLQVYPHVATKSVTVRGRVGGAGQLPANTPVKLSAGQAPVQTARVDAGGAFEAEYPLGADAQTWDEFQPALHRLTATLGNGESRTVTFGLREVATDRTQITVNGRRIFVRGTLECAIFPQTGHPPTDIAAWKRELGIVRTYGLNSLRFHSWCPPEAAFIAGDELGIYFQVEVASWPNQSTSLGDGKPVDAWINAETERMLRAYGNHPSFLLMAAGNEPGGRQSNAYLSDWVGHHKARDARRLYTSSAGWPQLPESQFHVTSDPRIQQWGAGLTSRINALPPETTTDYRDYIAQRPVPVISHEIGQWCAYPDLDEIPKYTGYLKPRNFEIFRETLAAHHLTNQAHAFLLASGKLQTLCYKEEIESALRTPGMGGFQLLGLQDFPGQGTALVGVLDPFWDSKGYVTSAEYRRFCNQTVPLARLAKRVFTTAETLEAGLEVAHFGAAPLTGVTPTWKLVADGGKIVAQGELPRRDIPIGNGCALGRIATNLAGVAAPARCRLIVGLAGTPFENDWDVWVYPPRVNTTAATTVTMADNLDAKTLATLDAGGTVFLSIPPDRVPGDRHGQVQLGFSNIFWNTAWTKRQAPHTLGILCDPQHPALAAFPTEYHSNWQWWYLVRHAGAMILDDLPTDLHPIVQVIDDWFTNRKLGLVFEARVGKGKLLVSSIDLVRDDNPVSRQLLASLQHYVASENFHPTVELKAEQLRGLMEPAIPSTALVPKSDQR